MSLKSKNKLAVLICRVIMEVVCFFFVPIPTLLTYTLNFNIPTYSSLDNVNFDQDAYI